MTAQSVQNSLIPESVLVTLQALSPEQRQQVFDFAEFLVQKQNFFTLPSAANVEKPKRIRDLDAGAVRWISDDFDAPLPDEFWFGENDPLMMTDAQIKQLNQASEQL
jgi:Protein of unknown function (DUF2281)